MNAPILEMRNISKEFPGVKALDNVSFTVSKGEIHCLVGENGAGKSTLMKVLSGVYSHGNYAGDILLNGEVQQFRNISDSEKAGIAIIYQELALVPEMTVYDNIFLGHEIKNALTVEWNETIKQAGVMLQKVKLDINPATKIKELGIGKQQLVEIAKALSKNVKLLILDEPTSSLNEKDSENLLQLLRDLKEQGVTCIMISHKLKEVISIADTVTVLRDGKTICTLSAKAGEVSEHVLIKNMVGREINNIYPPKKHTPKQEVVLEVKNWSARNPALGKDVLKEVNFKVNRGEIIGLAGLIGSGRTELALSVFGNPDKYQISGELYLEGTKRNFRSPKEAIDSGISYVSEDRKGNGLILIQDVKQNISLANLKELVTQGVVVDNNAEIKVANRYKSELNIKTPTVEQKVSNLSGGNQQKVCLGKWLFVKPNVLILDEPTRGIDVGAKYEIYTIMRDLVQQGMSIIMISSELPEVLGMSDRIYIVASGKIAGELSAQEATQEKIMHLATN
ncbi:MAG: ATP-binding cassette domain-containing protein [Anaerolineales bacterium]|jgi:putative multiple sugar transport system ATP-binding protein|uniref:ATP-binding cassette domain-containing protein n=1 Tax=Candidatus Villigracilis vicinus TaxID=3140679 RepID=UPI00313645C5|nr:ATP-binding cassette domain-containing protein [Anaerolineales bacterium]MBK7448975.1 ATP-binding cassette domain-containing protein [Anaerolineales bacterium]MBK9780717.1 ATP-binding cassette domain-containing protein [Anaerolineales bacterium]